MDPSDSRKDKLNSCFKECDNILDILLNKYPDEETLVTSAKGVLCKIQQHVEDLLHSPQIPYLNPGDISKPWKRLGEGHFGQVFEAKYRGSTVAVKVLKERAKSKFRESNLLRYLSHDNIIAYRGMGYIAEDDMEGIGISDGDMDGTAKMFVVMEYVPNNLMGYIKGLRTYENTGLPASQTWVLGQQVASALSYLHSLDIAHRDLKPDNILIEVGPKRMLVKVADFGLAWHSKLISMPIAAEEFKTVKHGYVKRDEASNIESGSYTWGPWGPPEFRESSESDDESYRKHTLVDYEAGDIYCFGLILAFTLTGQKPKLLATSSQVGMVSLDDFRSDIQKNLSGPLFDVLNGCLQEVPKRRLKADELLNNYFSTSKNPYQIDPSEVEFFSCGFMEKTDIFVADSCTDEMATQIGFYESKTRPSGYSHEDLKCRIEVEKAPYRDREDLWDKEDVYFGHLQKFLEMSRKKEIDNNPTVALKKLILARPGDEECQTVEATFKESDYCHHRSMREIWRSLSEQKRNEEIPCKGEVHPYFSTSFGLHVAVLTNEGPNEPQMFVFPQRANRKGMSSPGTFTCGAVESSSKPDYITVGDKTCVDLVRTAARGLKEELGLDLSGNDLDAICLTTFYMKFDFHEWGLCGFVDLTDERIAPEHRINAARLQDRFTSGPKDKFEHQKLTFVPFQLEPMVNFVFENHENFASSAKLVVVKVLQAFFGWQKVQEAFEMKIPKK